MDNIKLVKIKIENFRSYKEIEVELPNLSVIIGKNDVGKSTLLDALDIFFENTKLSESDKNVHSGDNDKVAITCFSKVPQDMKIYLDSAESKKTETTLESEYLLDDNKHLQIKKTWEKGKLKNAYIVANHPTNWKEPLITLKLNVLKEIIGGQGDCNRAIKKSMRDWLFNNNELEFSTREIDTGAKESDVISAHKSICDKLPRFFLFKADRTNTDKDTEVTNVTKAITADAIKGVEEKFASIKDEIKNSIQSFTDDTLQQLKEFDEKIADSLIADMNDKALESLFGFEFKDNDDIPFNKRGSGIKRLFLLSFFLADSQRKGESNMIYAIEEPETSQHPDYQLKIIETFQELAQQENRQVLLTTHTPEIVKLVNKENIIFIKKNDNNERIVYQNNTIVIKEIAEALGILPYVVHTNMVFVEGKSDVNFLNNLNDKFKCLREIFDITKEVKIMPFSGKGNIEHLIKEEYFKDSNVKQLYFMDSDNKDRDSRKEKSGENIKIIVTKRKEIENYFPIDVVENYFREKLGIDKIFSDKNKADWKTENIAQLIMNKDKNKKFKDKGDIKSMFSSKEIWQQITEENMQDFDEIKEWFKTMAEFFRN